MARVRGEVGGVTLLPLQELPWWLLQRQKKSSPKAAFFHNEPNQFLV